MAIKMVMFDMAGTTVQDNDDVNLCFQDAMVSTGLPITRDDINAVMGLRKPDAIRQILQEKLGTDAVVTDEHVHALHKVFLQRMIDFYKKDPRVKEIDGASDVFRQLKAAGVKVAIDSGFSRDIIDTIIERLGWERDGLIDISVASDEVVNARPHADMIKVAMAKFGIDDPKEVAKVGDTPADLGEGENSGCSINIAVLSGAYKKEELLPYPHTHIVDSIKDISAIILQ
ncbi:MAG: HAD hydrolase-like protein [Chitinophagales bacterium]|nr:HAD hydrolase-like protein [Chitinophagales bacterium]